MKIYCFQKFTLQYNFNDNYYIIHAYSSEFYNQNRVGSSTDRMLL